MITTYLRLDSYKKTKNGFELYDQYDLDHNEDFFVLLQDFESDSDYVELQLVTKLQSHEEENLVCCFRRTKLKGQKDYQWVVCLKK